MQKEYIYIKCWNEKGNYVGILAVYSAKEMEKYAKIYPRYEYVL
ncbi:MAG: hypothetical protein RBR93_09165 [Aliarcobacter butzleri]|nr:hypothetical protein [Aliarcobacter butzleri]